MRCKTVSATESLTRTVNSDRNEVSMIKGICKLWGCKKNHFF